MLLSYNFVVFVTVMKVFKVEVGNLLKNLFHVKVQTCEVLTAFTGVEVVLDQ